MESSRTQLSAQWESFSQQASLDRSEGQVGAWAVLRGWQRKEVGILSHQVLLMPPPVLPVTPPQGDPDLGGGGSGSLRGLP